MNPTLLRLGLPLSFAALLGAGTVLAPAPQEPAFKVHTVSGDIAYLEGVGGNIGLFNGPDGFLLIDTQLPDYEQQVVAAIAGHLGVDATLAGAAPLYLVNTHWHGDHIGNNEVFGRSKVPIVAHTNVRRRMTADGTIGGRTEERAHEALPTLTFEDELALHLNGESIRVRHYPAGHTDGDSVVYFETSKVVHCGDLFFNGMFPFIDAGSGGSPDGYAAAVKQILDATSAEWKYIPGHGPLASRADLESFHAMVTTCTQRVREALGEGLSVEEMLSVGILDDYSEAWNWNFIPVERFVADLAVGLSKGK